MNNKLQTKDLINLGLFTVLYFVIGCCVAIPIGFVPIFLPVLGSLSVSYTHLRAHETKANLAWRPDFEIRRL